MDVSADDRAGVDYYIDHLRREGELLADAAARAGFDAPVPACPSWQVRDLLRHIGYVHRWAAMYVREGHLKWVSRASEAEILRDGPPQEDLLGWFREGHAALVRTLQAADPAMTCWTFLEAPSPLAFWARRQAHETTMHRVDAEQAGSGAAAGAQSPVTARFAADGADELIMGFLARDAKRGSWHGPRGTLAFRAGDAVGSPACWRVDSAPGGLVVSREPGPADCEVTAPAADLYLLLWNRRPEAGLDVTGDAGLLTAFRHQAKVTWG